MQRRLSVKYLVVCIVVTVAWLAAAPEEPLYAQVREVFVSISPAGVGAVDDLLGGPISCPGVCSEAHVGVFSVELQADPSNPDYVFEKWQWVSTASGAGSSAANPQFFTLGGAGETLTVIAVFRLLNNPPVLAPIGDKTVNEGELLTFDISATDPDTWDTITYSALNLPAGASFSVRTFSWQPGFDQAGTYQVTFRASDGHVVDQETITITVNNVNRPPVLDPIGNQTVQAGRTLTIQASASDPDLDALSFSASPLPAGATFDVGTGTFQWTPVNSQSGSYQVAFAVSDGVFAVTETVTIAVGVNLPVLPEPFPFNQVNPLSGALQVDPTQPLCFSWPGAANTDAYQFLLAHDASFGWSELDVPGLSASQYCAGPLAYGMNYFWTVISSNTYGSVQYPVFGFATLFPPGATITAPGPFPGAQYKIFSVPVYPENPDPLAVLGDDLGPYRKSNWRLFWYSSADGRNHEYPDVPDMAPGIAYWLITRSEITLDAQGSAASTAEDFSIMVPPGFLQIGCPFYFPVSWSEVKVRNGQVQFSVTDAANPFISPVLWTYTNGQYQAAQELVPWKGCLVQNVSAETVELLIPPRMFVNPAASASLGSVSVTRNK